MKSLDYYRAILGVDAAVSPEKLRQAYLNLVKRWHPDRLTHNPELQKEAETKLKEINEAYKELQSALGSAQGPVTAQPRPPKPAANKGKEKSEAPKANPSTRHRRSSQHRAESAIEKKRRSRRALAARFLAAALGVLALFLTATAILNHLDPDRMATLSGGSIPLRLEPTPEAQLATEVERAAARIALGEKMKEHYDSTLKLLALHEEERARIHKDYLRQRDLYTKNMLSREELRQAEDALTAAGERIAEDRRWLAKAELAIAEAALAKEKLNRAEKEQ